MSIKKRVLKSKPVSKVTFKLSKEAAKASAQASLVGEFNDWDYGATPMKRLKNGSFTVTIDLENGREYRFRYLLDNQLWENDWEADNYEYCRFANCDNSIVTV